MTSFTQLFKVAQTGMNLNMLGLDTISDNLANFNTEGFKESRLDFQELLTQSVLSGARLANRTTNFTQGALKESERDMDWAIEGEGFFAVTQQDGTVAYSRQGSFQIDSNMNIVNGDGLPLVWSGSLPANASDVKIDTIGNVMYCLDGDTSVNYVAGQVQLYQFINNNGLDSIGNNLYLETDISGTATGGTPGSNGLGNTIGGYLESSNVDLSAQMTKMILTERIFQTTSKALNQTNTMMSEAISMRQS